MKGTGTLNTSFITRVKLVASLILPQSRWFDRLLPGLFRLDRARSGRPFLKKGIGPYGSGPRAG
jgi:hypothetical protein